jgi:hypothetical protein
VVSNQITADPPENLNAQTLETKDSQISAKIRKQKTSNQTLNQKTTPK